MPCPQKHPTSFGDSYGKIPLAVLQLSFRDLFFSESYSMQQHASKKKSVMVNVLGFCSTFICA